MEVILVDDGSAAEQVKFIDSIVDELNLRYECEIKVIHKTNGGVSSARNAGIKCAKGEYITFLDADDWIEPMAYEDALYSIIKSDAEVLEWGYFVDFLNEEDEIVSSRKISVNEINSNSSRRDVNEALGKIGYVWNKIYRASVILEKNIRFDENISLYEDALFNLDILNSGVTFRRIDSAFTHYNQRENTLGRTKNCNYYRIRRKVIQKQNVYLKSLSISSLLRIKWFVRENILTVLYTMKKLLVGN